MFNDRSRFTVQLPIEMGHHRLISYKPRDQWEAVPSTCCSAWYRLEIYDGKKIWKRSDFNARVANVSTIFDCRANVRAISTTCARCFEYKNPNLLTTSSLSIYRLGVESNNNQYAVSAHSKKRSEIFIKPFFEWCTSLRVTKPVLRYLRLWHSIWVVWIVAVILYCPQRHIQATHWTAEHGMGCVPKIVELRGKTNRGATQTWEAASRCEEWRARAYSEP